MDINSSLQRISFKRIFIFLLLISVSMIIGNIVFRLWSVNWSWSNLGSTINWLDLWGKGTYLSISLLIGAVVVNLLFENAKRNQWRTVRFATYKQIIYHLTWIATTFLYEFPLINESDPEYVSMDELVGIIAEGFNNPNKDAIDNTVKAYRDLQKMLSSILEIKNKELEVLGKEEQLDNVNKFIEYLGNDVLASLYHIKIVLTPRVLMLSGNKKLCEALARFDNNQVLIEQDIISHRKSANETGARYPLLGIDDLMNKAAEIYKEIFEDLTSKEIDEWG